MRMIKHLNFRNIAAALTVAAGFVTGTAYASVSEDLAAFEGRWNGRVDLACIAISAPMEIVIRDGDMSGKATIRGAGEGSGTYRISGYVDRKGRVSDAQMQGPFGLSMRGNLSNGEGKGQFFGPECSGNWKISLEQAASPTPPQEITASPEKEKRVAKVVPAADDVPPVIEAPGEMQTQRSVIELSGRVRDSSAIIEFTVNGAATQIQEDGSFQLKRGVAVGESEIVIAALDEWGNESRRSVRVLRAAPAEEPQIATRGQQSDDKQAPRITLPPKLVTDKDHAEIAGRIWDDSAITDVFINERRLALRADGRFRTRQDLKVGVNKFAFTAIDEWGNRAVKRIDVVRKKLDLALGNYHALVIGNNDYGDMPNLKTAVADAEAISGVLESRYGFNVTKLINATRYDVIGAMSELRASLSYDTNLLIYYAGHGIVDPVTERGYWLPVDADQSNPANWVSNDDITDMLKAIPARHILVIADSCYSGTLTRSAPINVETWEDRRAWLERMAGKRSRTALASGGLEPVADAGSGGHSVFAAALLSVLRENSEIIEAQALFAPVRKSVVLNANQTPVYSDIRMAGHDGGDFIFAPE